jgi:hypothetical protein
MNRMPACLWVLALVASPVAAARPVPVPAPERVDVSRAAAVAASYGAITSMYRSVAHNRAVGGVANSYHLHGRAIDVARRPGVTHAQIAAALHRAGYTMIESLDEGDHSHFAFASLTSDPRQVAAALPPPPPVPEPPKYPRVLADDHGTLRIDLPAAITEGR